MADTSNYPHTGSTLKFPGGQNKTSTGISTNIIITVQTANGWVPVGAVQSMSISEKRAIKMVDEVGTDGHIDSVPNQSTNISGSCQRVRFDRLRVAEAFSRSFVHVQSQAYPFNIVIFDKQTADPTTQISTVISNVWISGIDYTYQISDWVITDTMTWEAETIYSILGTSGNTPVAQGGERTDIAFNGGKGGTNNWVERQTDTGIFRGSLDASGLISLGANPTLF
jgi:hypothetical protein